MRRSSWRRSVTPAVLGASVLLLTGLGWVATQPAVSAPSVPVLVAAGDIDGCANGDATGKLVAGIDGAVAALGDNAYPSGSASDYRQCYDPTWGKVKDRTHPVPGNHDYDSAHAAGYFGYFGAAAGPANLGYYSYDVGTWHVVALNSNCGDVDCDAEGTWLDSDLSAHPAPCTLAYWHHPRFSSGSAGTNPAMNTFWKVLYDHRASVVLSGHDHDYERFAPQNPSGRREPGRGIRQFVVGTGGGAPGSFYSVSPNSEIRNNHTFGVLELTLRPDGYDWKFLGTPGGGFTDSGSDVCSGAAAAAPTTTTPAPPPAAEGPGASQGPGAAEGPPAAAPPATAQPSPSAHSDPPAHSAPPPHSDPRGGGSDRPAASGPPSTARSGATRSSTSAGGATDRSGSAGSEPSRSSFDTSPSAAAADPPGTAPPSTTSSPADAPPASSSGPSAGLELGSASGLLAPIGASPSALTAPPDAESWPLLAAIGRLTQEGSIPSRPDRRPLTIVAVALLVLNGAALSALNRKGFLRR